MEVRHVFLADYFANDEAGKFLIGGGFSIIAAPEYPSTFSGSYLIVVLEKVAVEQPSTVNVKVVIRALESNESISTAQFPEITFPALPAGSPQTLNVRIALAGLVLPSDGRYSFDVFLDETLKSSLTLTAATASSIRSERVEE